MLLTNILFTFAYIYTLTCYGVSYKFSRRNLHTRSSFYILWSIITYFIVIILNLLLLIPHYFFNHLQVLILFNSISYLSSLQLQTKLPPLSYHLHVPYYVLPKGSLIISYLPICLLFLIFCVSILIYAYKYLSGILY